MKFYNTLTKKKELFKPLKGKEIKIFVCGITSQDFPHIGHAKTYAQFDCLVKYLRSKGYKLFYLQNITDIDDRIIDKAKEEEKDWKEISRKFESVYLENMKSLHINSISKYARATDFIPQIVTQVQTLIKKGFAYKINDGYYFDLSKFPDYGKLSGRKSLDAEDSVSRIDESINKRNRGDFCLWKFSSINEPSWDSPIGKGRPGWHIEDTSISEYFFGPQYDIHGGARDLIFPHHEAEIAQMESASGKKPFVKYWLHTGFLNAKGQKMSKSLKNFITISELLKKYDYKVIRFFFLINHYRAQIDFNEEILEQSKNALQRINNFILNSKDKKDNVTKKEIIMKRRVFYKALDDDFDTPKAFSILFDFIRNANKKGSGKNCYKFLEEIDNIFDIFTLEEKIPNEIINLAKLRLKARMNKNFKLGDQLRSKIKKLGYLIDDIDEGYKIKKIR